MCFLVRDFAFAFEKFFFRVLVWAVRKCSRLILVSVASSRFRQFGCIGSVSCDEFPLWLAASSSFIACQGHLLIWHGLKRQAKSMLSIAERLDMSVLLK